MGVDFTSNKTEHFLDQCPQIDVNAQGRIFSSALQAAAYSGQTLLVRLLLGRKASINMHRGKYKSALNKAIFSSY
jgi:hypothetical protein